MSSIQLDPQRDPWDRQPGEKPEPYDWFLHYRDEGERRSYARTAERFGLTVKKIRHAAERDQWQARLSAFQQAQSAQIQAIFAERVERMLVPWSQAAMKMIQSALQNPKDPPADRALAAATDVLRLAKEPTVSDLVRIADAGSGSTSSGHSGTGGELADTIMHALEDFPQAREAAIEAVRARRDEPS